ncbi:MAG: IS110 family transposase [Marinilabiliaceae bacterium]|nr:IS110 family transposase [Marinilabiliaceae bacterium]
MITAILIILELEDVCRFKSLDQLCSYVGLIPSTSSSGDKDIVGEITSRGHSRLRTAIVETSWVAVKNDPALLMAYSKLCKRMEPNKAIIRIAKKLLNRIRYVLKNQNEYVKAVVK